MILQTSYRTKKMEKIFQVEFYMKYNKQKIEAMSVQIQTQDKIEYIELFFGWKWCLKKWYGDVYVEVYDWLLVQPKDQGRQYRIWGNGRLGQDILSLLTWTTSFLFFKNIFWE